MTDFDPKNIYDHIYRYLGNIIHNSKYPKFVDVLDRLKESVNKEVLDVGTDDTRGVIEEWNKTRKADREAKDFQFSVPEIHHTEPVSYNDLFRFVSQPKENLEQGHYLTLINRSNTLGRLKSLRHKFKDLINLNDDQLDSVIEFSKKIQRETPENEDVYEDEEAPTGSGEDFDVYDIKRMGKVIEARNLLERYKRYRLDPHSSSNDTTLNQHFEEASNKYCPDANYTYKEELKKITKDIRDTHDKYFKEIGMI